MTRDASAHTATGDVRGRAPQRSDRGASVTVAAVAFVVVTGETLPVGLIGDVARGLDATESQVGLTVGWYALVAALSAVPLTRLTSGLDRRTILVACAVVFGAGHVVAALATDLGVLVAGRSVAALAHGLYFAVATPAAVRIARPEAKARAGGRIAVGGSMALVLGTPLVTLLGQAAGWRAAMLAVAATTAVLGVVVVRLLPPLPAVPESRSRSSGGVLATLRSRALAVVLVVSMVLVAGHFAMFTYVAPYSAERLSVEGTAFSVLLLVYGACAVLGSTIAGRLSERHPVRVARVAAATLALATAGMWVAAGLGARPVGVALLVVWGGTFSLLVVCTALAIVRRAPAAQSETAFALHGIAFQAGILAGSAIGATSLATGRLSELPLVTAGAGLLVLGLLLRAGGAFRGGPVG